MFRSSAFRAVVSAVLALLLALPANAGDLLRGGAAAATNRRTGGNAANAEAREAAQLQANARDRLARTTQALQSMKAMQQAARQAAQAQGRLRVTGFDGLRGRQALPRVPDGLGPGGLQLASGVPKDLRKPGKGENPALWIGAELPTERGGRGGQKTVTIKQTEQNALLNWETFNVGKKTTLVFDQSKGGNDRTRWIAFNKVNDPQGRPSQILGSIRADGQVYVINRNGIIFGGTSQVNTHTLVASGLPINETLINRGLLDNPDAEFLFGSVRARPISSTEDPQVLPEPIAPDSRTTVTYTRGNLERGTLNEGADYTLATDKAGVVTLTLTTAGRNRLAQDGQANTARINYVTTAGSVLVEAGARLSAPTSAANVGGRVMLVGRSVENRGTLSTPDGQSILAAGLQVGIEAHSSDDPSLRGLDVSIGAVDDPAVVTRSAGGIATNSGLIEAPRGNITIAGKTVRQSGVLESSTSVALNGRIDLLANYNAVSNAAYDPLQPSRGRPFVPQSTGNVFVEDGSVMRILPEVASEASVVGTKLALRSRVNVVGQAIHLASGSILQAPNAQVDITAGRWLYQAPLGNAAESPPRSQFLFTGGQIYLDRDAIVDVSGSTGLELAITRNILDLELRGAELADAPLQREGLLRGVPISVDIREYGTYAGRDWIGTPLGDVTGFVNLIERGVAELTTTGGDVNLRAGGSVVLQRGSTVDVSGGWLRYQDGVVQTTRVVSGGRLFDISEATPDLVYDGFYSDTNTVRNAKYGITRTFRQPLALSGRRFEPGYVEGANAGSIAITAPAMALDGKLSGKVVAGARQIRDANFRTNLPRGGALNLTFKAQDPSEDLTVPFPEYSPTPPRIVFSEQSQPGVRAFALDVLDNPLPLPVERQRTLRLNPALVNEDGFSTLVLNNSDGRIDVPADVSLQAAPGGRFEFRASRIDIAGEMRSPGGTMDFTVYAFSPFLADIFASDPSSPDFGTPRPDPNRGDFILRPGAILSTAGVNVDDRPAAGQTFERALTLDGGTVSVTAFNARLLRGATVDVSGGVGVSLRGTQSFGDAGSVAVRAGQDPRIESLLGGRLTLGAELRGYSGAEGGSLTLQAPLLRVGGGPVREGFTRISPDLFNEGGFSRFALIGIGGKPFRPDPFVTGSLVDPEQAFRSIDDDNFLPGLVIQPGTTIAPVVASLFVRPIAGPDGAMEIEPTILPEIFRSEISLSFSSRTVVDAFTRQLVVRGDVVMGENASVRAGPRGQVSFSGDAVSILGRVRAPGGAITIAGASRYPLILRQRLAPQSTVFLGPDALLSTAGRLVRRPSDFGYREGEVLSGGTITIRGNIVAMPGSMLDVSGSTATLDFHPSQLGLGPALRPLDGATPLVPVTSGLNAPLYARTVLPAQVDSDAGAISLEGAQFLFVNSTLLGAAGGPSALGGSLRVSSGRFYADPQAVPTPRDITLVVTQDKSRLPSTFEPARENGLGITVRAGERNRAVQGQGYFSVEQFAQGGFDALELAGVVRFRGRIDIEARRSISVADGGVLFADRAVRLTAPYVRLGTTFLPPLDPLDPARESVFRIGSNPFPIQPRNGTGRLIVRADLIDVGNLTLQGFKDAALIADGGDIRGNGAFDIAGDLFLRAAQIYPVTAGDFTLTAWNYRAADAEPGDELVPGRITVRSSGERNLPLSAGGELSLYAAEIDQGGVLRAPMGRINIGWDGSGDGPNGRITGRAVPVADSVTLRDGSQTSVSAIDPRTGEGVLIPFGLLVNGTSWVDPRGVDITAGGGPEKDIRLGASSLVTDRGSVIDIRGGGDLYAFRWVQGQGGSTDVLASSGAFAVIPGYDAPFAPYGAFNADADLLDGEPGYVNASLKVGDQVYLRESEALPAGSYTLLPARYALLPGAVLVTPQSGAAPRQSLSSPEGGNVVAGYRYNGLDAARKTPEVYTRFEVASSEVFRARALYEDYTANLFLRQSAGDLGVPLSRLPVDAGHLVFQAGERMALRGTVDSRRPEGGIGAFIDISSPADILITGAPPKERPKNTIVLNARILTGFGAESLFIGGVRESADGGTVANVFAGRVTLDNRGVPLSAPEVTLAATRELTLAPGAQITQRGTMVAQADTLLLDGDGALVRVSSDPDASVQRVGVTDAAAARLTVGRNADLSGVSLVLDSAFATDLSPRANLSAQYVRLASGQISLQLDSDAKVGPTEGLVLAGGALRDLEQARFLSLLSYTAIDIHGAGRFNVRGDLELHAAQIRGFGQEDGRATIRARELTIDNLPRGRRLAADDALAGSLAFKAGRVNLGMGRVTVDQIANFEITATRQVRIADTGSLFTPGDLVLTTPYLDSEGSARYSIRAVGSLRLLAPENGASPAVSPGLGADLTLRGRSVVADANIVLPSGQVSIVADTGDLSIGGRIDVGGRRVAFNDVVIATDAGNISLVAEQGSIALRPEGALLLSAPRSGGNAGLLTLRVPQGELTLEGRLVARAGEDGSGGRFALDVGELPQFSALATVLAKSGFTAEQTIRVRRGDVTIAGNARSSAFRLSADDGNILVLGRIDASGETGGSIFLSASGDLTVADGAILTVAAKEFDRAGKGGAITLEAGSATNGVAKADARLDLRSGALIDLAVAANTATSAERGLFTGKLHLRAPRSAANDELGIEAINATVRGASSIIAEGYRVYDLTATNGVMTNALRTQVNNESIAFLGAAGSSVPAYTAMFDRLLANNADLASVFSLRPGVEIINRNGDLTLGSTNSQTSLDWNLQTFRYGAKSAPGILTLRATGDIVLFNSIQDGFNITNQNQAYFARLSAPNAQLPLNAQSWSYRITAGSNLAAADFRAVLSPAQLATNVGSLRLGKNFTGIVSGGFSGATVNAALNVANSRYQVIRTGSGDIDISAGRDVRLMNPFAAIYSAGTLIADPTLGGRFDVPILNNAGAQPNLGALQQSATVAQYTLGGGNVRLAAQSDIARYTVDNLGTMRVDSSRQLPGNWLYRRGFVDPNTGEFGPAAFGDIASTTWWVDFANFFQSVGAFGGGHVSLLAGRDVVNVDAVAATNARMPKGRPDADAMVEIGGGDVLVRAGRDISGGVYYVERGAGTLEAGRSITTNSARSPSRGLIVNEDPLPEQTWLPTTLFVGKGTWNLRAGDDILLGPVSNPFLLPGGMNNTFSYKSYFTTYAPTSGVDAVSLGGDVTLRQVATRPIDNAPVHLLRLWLESVLSQNQQGSVSLIQPWLRLNESGLAAFTTTPTLMPGTLRVAALSGDVNVVGDLTLTPASRGTLELLARGSINALQPSGVSDIAVPGQAVSVWTSARINVSDADPNALPRVTSPFAYQNVVGISTAARSSGTNNFLSFIDALFQESGTLNNALQVKQTLHARGPLHADDPDPLRLYALDGNIAGLTVFSPKALRAIAGVDITDVSFYAQNVRPEDVSIVAAGRDIIPNNANAPLRALAQAAGNFLPEAPEAGDIQIGGPGLLQVFAGRNVDLGTGGNNLDGTGVGITTVGNLRNPFLPFEGASIVLAAGLGSEGGTALDYQRFIDEFLAGDEIGLASFAEAVGLFQAERGVRAAASADDIARFVEELSPGAQSRLLLSSFFLSLRNSGRAALETGNYDSGYAAIEALFGDGQYRGDILARARDIRTRNGGDISLLAPGGGIALANTELGNTLAPPGIVTESGGRIDVFVKDSVDIGIGRIFTLRGGDIMIWASEGDIAAGSAAKTVASAPPTRVVIDPQSADVATDLAGLATGGGIGVLATVAGVEPGAVDLIAPVGTVDAGDAGIRASGTVTIAAERVLNAGNISAAAGTAGVPSSAPPAAAPPPPPPPASSNTAATNQAANDIASQARQEGSTDEVASTITVEVLGYGGGSREDEDDEDEDRESASAEGTAPADG